MGISEDRTEELPTRTDSSGPTTAEDDDPTVPGKRTEPRRGAMESPPADSVRTGPPATRESETFSFQEEPR